MRKRHTLLMVLAIVLAPAGPGMAGELWSVDLPAPALWHRITGAGDLLVSDAAGLSLYAAAAGDVLWRRADMRGISGAAIRDVADTPMVLALVPAKAAKPRGKSRKSRRGRKKAGPAVWQAIDSRSGQTIWQLPGLEGGLKGQMAFPGRDLIVLFVDYKAKKRKQSGVYLEGRRLSDGARLWRTRYSGTRARLFGRGGSRGGRGPGHYARPALAGDILYLPFLGLHALDLSSGAVVWGQAFNTADSSRRRVSASPVVDDGIVYGAGPGFVGAYDAATGKPLWRKKVKRGPFIAELHITPELVVARMGGTFTTGAKLDGQKPFGVVAFNKADGKERWRYAEAEKAASRLVVNPAANMVIFSDATHIIGLRLSSGIVEFESPRAYWRRYGIFKEKSGGFAIGGGYSKSNSGGVGKALGGMLGMGSSGLEIGDIPLAAELIDGAILIRGPHHIMAFDPAVRVLQWSALFGPSGFIDSTVLSEGRMPAFSARGRAYYLTVLSEGKGRREHDILTLLGVSRRSGKVVMRRDITGAAPSFLIDAANDRLFRFVVTGKRKKARERIVADGL